MKKLFTLFILFVFTGISYGQNTNKKYASLSFNRNDYVVSVYNTYHQLPVTDYFWSNKITSKIIWRYICGSNYNLMIPFSDISYLNTDEVRTNVWEGVNNTNWILVWYTNYSRTNLTWTNYLIHFPKITTYSFKCGYGIQSPYYWNNIYSNFSYIPYWNNVINYPTSRSHTFSTYDQICLFNVFNYTNKWKYDFTRIYIIPNNFIYSNTWDIIVEVPFDIILKNIRKQNFHPVTNQPTLYWASQQNIEIKTKLDIKNNHMFYSLMEKNKNYHKGYFLVTNIEGIVYRIWDTREYITSTNVLTLTVTNQ